MRTGLSALQHIRQTLMRSQEFRDITSGRIYYVAATMGTARPYITTARTATVSEYTKDGWEKDSVIVGIEVVADTYDIAVQLSEVVRAALENHSAEYSGWEVRECTLTRSADGYSLEADAFVITLEFTLEIY